MADTISISATVNDRKIERDVPARLTLVDLLRHELGLHGTHVGCEQGVCGMCTVIVDGDPVKSCLLLAAQINGCSVRTVESLATGDQLHPAQEAFRDAHGLQCGYCTPGFLMMAVALAESDEPLDRETLRGELAGVLCRCTGYQNILNAVQSYLDGARAARS